MRLKVTVHSGEAVFCGIGEPVAVSGVDAIKAHRLLKNSVPSHEYILFTNDAFRDLGRSLDLRPSGQSEEICSDDVTVLDESDYHPPRAILKTRR
jgi:hypothetical protein